LNYQMKTKLERIDWIWEIISVLLLIANALLIALSLPNMPDIVPIHFNGSGEANGWGSKNMIWIAFGLALPIYALLTFISFKPGLYRSRMTEKNLDEQYRLTSKMARTVKAFASLAFCVLTLFMIMAGQGKWQKQIPLLLIIFFVLIIPPCIYYAIKISRVQ
jgi:uncharacterized membrane protein